jgi:hypothetical protein
MKKALAIIMAVLSIPFLTVSVLFLIAMVSRPSRGLVGAVLFAIGVALLWGGIRWLRRLASLSPDALRTGAIDLARRLGGEVTLSQLRAEYDLSQRQAQEILDSLVREGSARREERSQRVVYVFTGLLPSLSEKVCPYCGTQLPVRSNLRKCPNCGATLEITKT